MLSRRAIERDRQGRLPRLPVPKGEVMTTPDANKKHKVTLTFEGLSEHLQGWPISFSTEVDEETFKRWMSRDAKVEIFAFGAGDERGSLFGECDLTFEDTPA